MSEIKPCGWAARSQSGAFLTLAAERQQVECHPQIYRSDELIPLYDGNTVAIAIAEAVAAERERCAKVCEAHSNSALCSAMIGGPDAQGLQHISYAHQRAAQSIRGATK